MMKPLLLLLIACIFTGAFIYLKVNVSAQQPNPTPRSACEQYYLEAHNIVLECGRDWQNWFPQPPQLAPTATPHLQTAPIPTQVQPLYGVTLYRLRVREWCALDADVIYVAGRGETILLTGDRQGDWYYTQSGGCVLERGTDASGNVIINLALFY